MSWPPKFSRYGITLAPLAEEWLETIRRWRNDPVIKTQMLDKTEITPAMQQRWFDGLKGDETRAYYVAWFKDEPIGVASLSAIDRDNQTAEPGMYIYPDRYRNNIVPFCVAFALNDLAFEELSLTRLYGKIFSDNAASLRFHEKCGYKKLAQSAVNQASEQDNELIYYQLDAEDYYQARAPIARFIRY